MKDLMELVNECPVIIQNNEKAESALRLAEELKAAGFMAAYNKLITKAHIEARLNKLAQYKYVQISEKKILDFLRKKVDAYNAAHRGDKIQKQINPMDRLFWGAYAGTVEMDSQILSAHDNTAMAGMGSYHTTPSDPVGSWAQSESGHGQASYSIATIHAMSSDITKTGRFHWVEERIEDYREIPPSSVLQALQEHRGRDLFDYFTVAKMIAEKPVPDPLLLGRIKGLKERFFLHQWGDDLALDDII